MSWRDELFDYVESLIDEGLASRRMGFYAAKTTGVLQQWRRVQVAPEWMPNSAAQRMRRIASPLLDVVPPASAWVAMIAQDGVPELSTVLGMIWDDRVAPLTAWVRAQLATQPGHMEIGATRGVRIRLSDADPYDPKDELVLDVLGDGTLQLDAHGARITIEHDGSITLHPATGQPVRVGEGASAFAARADRVEDELNDLWTALKTHTHPVSGGVAGAPSITGAAGSTAADRLKTL